MRMGKASESVRFLDDVDLTLSLDSRSSSAQHMTSIEVTAKPVVFRVSYRDINIITAIVNKAILLHGNTRKSAPSAENDTTAVKSLPSQSSRGPAEISNTTSSDQQPQHAIGKARVLMSKEQVRSIQTQPGCEAHVSFSLRDHLTVFVSFL
jgi:vacuolar protein sorting-associated protein 13A/C